jgi:hypothetical protein
VITTPEPIVSSLLSKKNPAANCNRIFRFANKPYFNLDIHLFTLNVETGRACHHIPTPAEPQPTGCCYQLSAVSYQLLAIGYQFSALGFELFFANCRLFTFSFFF